MTKQHGEPRYVLTGQGLDHLADHEGIELEALAREAGYTYLDERTGRIVGALPSDLPHQLGINAFVVQLVVDARKQGGELVDWLNAAESEHRFTTSTRRRVRISPDSAIGLEFNGAQHWSLLEYEKARVDEDELQAKLVGYSHYYESSEWKSKFSSEPMLLYVCASSRAEGQVLRALSRMPAGIPAFVTAEERYRHSESTSLGTMGRIWRSPGTTDFGWAFPQIGA